METAPLPMPSTGITRKMKRNGAIVVLIIAVLVAGRLIAQRGNQEEEARRIPKVSLISVSDYQKSNAYVNAVGEVESLEQVDIRAELSAPVAGVYKRIGDEAKRGDLLVELDHASLDAQLSQAAAAVESAKSALASGVAGATQAQEDQAHATLASAEAAAQQSMIAAQAALDTARNNLRAGESQGSSQIIEDAYDDVMNALRAILTTLSDSLRESDNILGIDNKAVNDAFEGVLGALSGGTMNQAESTYLLAKEANGRAEAAVLSLNSQSSREEAEAAVVRLEEALDAMSGHLLSLKAVLDATLPLGALTQDQLDGMRSTVTGQQSAIIAARASITGAKQSLSSAETSVAALQIAYEKALSDFESAQAAAESSVALAQAALAAATDELRQEDRSGLEAGVASAQAAYALVAANRDNAFIRAPIDGAVGTLPVRVGDLVAPGTPLVSLVNVGGLQLKAFISHSDRTLISEGASVIVEGGIPAVVERISPSVDPATKKIEISIVIIEEGSPLAVGQFASARVSINEELVDSNIYFLPLASVQLTSEGSYVYEVDDQSKVTQRKVEIAGVVGDLIEITSGLEAGARIAASVRGLEAGDEVEVR